MNTENKMHFSPAQPQDAQAPWSERLRHSKALIPTMAVLAVTTLALAATLVSQRSEALNGGRQAEAVVQSPQAMSQLAPAKETSRPAVVPAAREVERPVAKAPPKALPCSTCGTVESVTTVQRQGSVNGIGNSGIGVGAIGGAVVGGLLGNQVGGGSGKKAATVLGAVGGGYAGHAIEKNANSYTAYQMRVRMSDGTVRVIEQRSAVAAGAQVAVEGNTLRVLPPSDGGGVRG
jgi:outer membrane lipoprotein SlyB